MENMIDISIGDLVIDMYLDNYSVNIIERYATDINFTSISGKTMNKYLGDRRELSVNFEPMENNQINQLFQKIKSFRNNIPIKYNDPQKGLTTKYFSCNNLPSATYFISDDGRKFWTIPTVVFTETDESASADDVEPDGSIFWDYVIQIGSDTYNSDEISSDINVNISSGSNGFSVGECCASTISGTLLYKGTEKTVEKNTVITLYAYKKEIINQLPQIVEMQEYKWFIVSYTIQDKTLIAFSGVDAVAFVDNGYPKEGRVANHIAAASATISELCGQTVTISEPPYSQMEAVGLGDSNIRTLLQYASVYGACNYTALFDLQKTNGEIRIALIDDSSQIAFSSNDHASVTVGLRPPLINQIRVSQTGMEDPVLQEDETYDDYGIYYLNRQENVKTNMLSLVCPWAEPDIKTVGNLHNKIGKSYGKEFNCEAVKVNTFYSPYMQVIFSGYESGEDDVFYISSASYKLTTIGIFANLSGNTRSLSDTEYIGKTETELKTKVALKVGYKNGFISQEDGIYWDDLAVEENVNNG